jgi:hypothetical protein
MNSQSLHPALVQDEDPQVINFQLLNLWIRTCEDNHQQSCGLASISSRHKKRRSSRPLSIILIDVIQYCLVESTTDARYLALSYVWGGVPQLMLSRKHWDQFSKPHSLLQQNKLSEEIPLVIKDAIRLTGKLNERFLWVDSLCIFQDDSDSKHDQISHMSQIFQGAALTILAVACKNASVSLPGVRAGTRAWSYKNLYGADTDAEDSISARHPREDQILNDINQSTYSSRGWVFQERLLSRRCLIFLPNGVYFQCQSEFFFEGRASLTKPLSSTQEGFLDTLNTLHQIHAVEDFEGIFSLYAQLVCEYSWKKLSYPEDVVDAFTGILSIMESNFGWKFSHGIPTEPREALERALFWVPYRAQSKLERSESSTSVFFPTWSWAAWTGAVDFWPVLRPRGPNQMFIDPPPELKTLVSRVGNIRVLSHNEFGQNSDQELPSTNATSTQVSIRSKRQQIRQLFNSLMRHKGVLARHGKSVSKSSPTPQFRSISTLHFKTHIVQANNFEYEPSLPWQAVDFMYITPSSNASKNRDGVWIISTGREPRDVGFLFGISLENLQNLAVENLFFALLSETSFGTLTGTWVPDDTERFSQWAHHRDNWSGLAYQEWQNPSQCYNVPRQLNNVLLLYSTGSNRYERVAAGQVDQAAWSSVPTKRTEIQLI